VVVRRTACGRTRPPCHRAQSHADRPRTRLRSRWRRRFRALARGYRAKRAGSPMASCFTPRRGPERSGPSVVDRARTRARRARRFASAAVGDAGGACAQHAYGPQRCRMPARPSGSRSTVWRRSSRGRALSSASILGSFISAAALGVPLVAIFTASEPGLTGPMGQGPIAVVGGKHKQPSSPKSWPRSKR